MTSIIVLFGDIGSGKTTVCARLVELARGRGLDVAGVYSPARLRDGRKVGIDVVDAATGERRGLADLIVYNEGPPVPELPWPPPGPATQRWQFHAAAVAWGQEVIRGSTPCDLLVIDELGPLELERGEGWTAALDALPQGRYRLAVIVVRRGLVPGFTPQLLQWTIGLGGTLRVTVVFSLTRDQLPLELLTRHFPAP